MVTFPDVVWGLMLPAVPPVACGWLLYRTGRFLVSGAFAEAVPKYSCYVLGGTATVAKIYGASRI